MNYKKGIIAISILICVFFLLSSVSAANDIESDIQERIINEEYDEVEEDNNENNDIENNTENGILDEEDDKVEEDNTESDIIENNEDNKISDDEYDNGI